MAARRWIGEILVHDYRLLPQDVAAAMRLQPPDTGPRPPEERLGKILVRMGVLADRDLVTALAQQLGIPVVLDLPRLDLEEALLSLVPPVVAEKKLVIPVERVDRPSGMVLAMADPLDLATLKLLEKRSAGRVWPAIAPEEEIRRALKVFYAPGGRALRDPGRATDSIESIRRRYTGNATVPADLPPLRETTL